MGRPAAVAGDQLVLPVDPAHRGRLQQSSLPDGLGDIPDPRVVVTLTWEGAVLKRIEGEVEDLGSRGGDSSGRMRLGSGRVASAGIAPRVSRAKMQGVGRGGALRSASESGSRPGRVLGVRAHPECA